MPLKLRYTLSKGRYLTVLTYNSLVSELWVFIVYVWINCLSHNLHCHLTDTDDSYFPHYRKMKLLFLLCISQVWLSYPKDLIVYCLHWRLGTSSAKCLIGYLYTPPSLIIKNGVFSVMELKMVILHSRQLVTEKLYYGCLKLI